MGWLRNTQFYESKAVTRMFNVADVVLVPQEKNLRHRNSYDIRRHVYNSLNWSPKTSLATRSHKIMYLVGSSPIPSQRSSYATHAAPVTFLPFTIWWPHKYEILMQLTLRSVSVRTIWMRWLEWTETETRDREVQQWVGWGLGGITKVSFQDRKLWLDEVCLYFFFVLLCWGTATHFRWGPVLHFHYHRLVSFPP